MSTRSDLWETRRQLHRWNRLAVSAAIVGSIVTAVAQRSDAPPQQVRRLALLVGVTDFMAPAMKKYNLRGPANDVELFRALLTGNRFAVPADAIVTLAGLPSDEAARPTHANIEREFQRLRDAARPDDQILILLAGHGSQQPADVDPEDDEPDGLDEIFLPSDVTGWDASTSHVANAIVDDEIRQWVAAISGKGAVVTVIVDACHSGTITRGGTSDWRDRGIPVEALIPESALAEPRSRSATRALTQATKSRVFDLGEHVGDVIALYAAGMSETTPELAMPDRDGPTHGLFTYTIARILSERTAPLTYRELVQRVTDRYRAEGFNPTPLIEGAGVGRQWLGDRSAHDRPTFGLDTRGSAGRWAIDGGAIHGITRGSILEIMPPDGSGAIPDGYLRVTQVRPTTSVATPVAFAQRPVLKATQVKTGSRVRVRQYEFGAFHLRVALQRPAPGGGFAMAAAGSGPPPVERALGLLPVRSDGLVERVRSGPADWFVRVAGNRVVLVASSTQATPADTVGAGHPTVQQFDVGALDDTALADNLARQLRRVARAANLSRLSAYVDPEADVQVSVLRHRQGAAEPVPFPAADGDPGVSAGDRLQFTIENTGKVPLDVTLLYVTAYYEIVPLFPSSDAALDNRIGPGEQRALAPVEITADPVGWEYLATIGVQATPRHENFLMLAQESLVEGRGAATAPKSPVRTLLESALYGTRALKTDEGEERVAFAFAQNWFRVEAPGK